MEGKEIRVGAAMSALWATTTTATSNGSVDAMHDSLTPLAGLVALSGMWLNTIFGGVGVGFINLLVYVVVAVFVAGMMIGRTPELLGKKVESREMQLASLTLLLHPALILGGTAAACAIWAATADPTTALAWLKNPGPHGFSEMLYEFTSAAANNGSGFEGLGDNTTFWNVTTGVVMLVGRYVPIVAPLALAASLAAKAGGDRLARLARHRHGDLRRHAVGRDRHPRPADVPADGGAGADRRAPGRLGVAMRTEIVRAIVFTAATMLLFGGAFPGLLWGIGRVAFPAQADGSLIRRADGTIVGSRLIAQRFTRAEYFHPRPSAVGYDAASTGAQQPRHDEPGPGPSGARTPRRRAGARRGRAAQVPIELVTASGSGLDSAPHVCPRSSSRRRAWRRRAASAPLACTRWSRPRVEAPLWGLFGPARVNVLLLNLALDDAFGTVSSRRQPGSRPMSARASQTSLWNPAIVRQAIVDAVLEARSARPVPQPGDVPRRGRQRADDGHLRAGARRPAPAIRASPASWPAGCGSRCCSPTSPRRWPKAAARRRRRRCAGRAPRRRRARLADGGEATDRRRRRCAPATWSASTPAS